MAASDDTTGNSALCYREVISREPQWWVATIYGPFLPADGIRARSRTLAGLEEATAPLYPSGEMSQAPGYDGSFSTEIAYDFDADHDAFTAARIARMTSAEDYAKHGRAIASEIRDQGGTLAEIAAVLHVSRWEAARLIAEPPLQHELVHFHWGGFRHQVTEHTAPAVAHATRTAAGMTRIIAADVLREARRRYARRGR